MRAKTIVTSVLFCVCLSLFYPTAFAYDFQDEAFEEDAVYQSVMDKQDQMLKDLYDGELQSQLFSTGTTHSFGEGAQKILNCGLDELAQIFESGFDEEMASGLSYSWLVPVSESDTECSYIIVTPKEDGNFSYVTVSSSVIGKQGMEFLFDPTLVPSIIMDSQLEQPEQTALLSVGGIANIVVFSNGDSFLYIPFAERPDFLKVENGRIYTADELIEIITAYAKEMEEIDFSPITGAGVGVGHRPEIFWPVPLLATVVVCGTLLYLHNKKRV